jgi:hypothetical protein
MTHVTIYRGAKAPEPIDQADFPTWDAWVDELEAMLYEPPDCLEDADPATQKECMLAFAPHRLREPYRKATHVTAVTFMCIDVDACDPEAIAARLAALGWTAFMYASPRDAPEARRVRVLAPMSRELRPDECKAARYAFAEALGLGPGVGVEGAQEAAKLFFAGRMHGTPPRQTWRFGPPAPDAPCGT